MAGVGSTKTKLVVSDGQRFRRFLHLDADDRRADELRHSGAAIQIVSERELRPRLSRSAE